MRSRSDSYAAAGVDITAGYRAVELMKSHVARTLTPGVIGDVGGFGGLFAPDFPAWPSRCWCPAPTAWAPS
jgi:phosphoribosylformylglycinamidine cyclo-ligase